MAIMELDRSRWHEYFNEVTKALRGKQAEIEISGLDVGSQLETDWTGLYGLTFDPKDDLFEVSTQSHSHFIHHPREIRVDVKGVDLQSVEIVDSENHKQLIRLRMPLSLRAP